MSRPDVCAQLASVEGTKGMREAATAAARVQELMLVQELPMLAQKVTHVQERLTETRAELERVRAEDARKEHEGRAKASAPDAPPLQAHSRSPPGPPGAQRQGD